MNILWFIPTHGDGRYLDQQKGQDRQTIHILNRLLKQLISLVIQGLAAYWEIL